MKWRWAKDAWLSRDGLIIKYDKIEHAVFFFILTFLATLAFSAIAWHLFVAIKVQSPMLPEFYVFLLMQSIGIANEAKDALLDYERFGWIGGDGFSFKDLAANQWGIVCGLVAGMKEIHLAPAIVAIFVVGLVLGLMWLKGKE